MDLKTSIFLTFFVPITLTSTIILVLIYYLINDFTNDYTDTMQRDIINDTTSNVNQVINAMQFKLQQDYQSIVIYITAMNQLINQMAKNPKIINPNYLAQPIGQFNFNQYKQFLQQHPSYDLNKLEYFTSSFYNSNVADFDELTDSDKDFINLKKQIDILTYTFIKDGGINLINLLSTYIISIDSGTTYDYPNNIGQYQQYISQTPKKLKTHFTSSNCDSQTNTYPYNFKCSSWFQQANSINNNNITFTQPYLDSLSKTFISTVCVKTYDMKYIFCFDFNIKSNPFGNNNNGTSKSYYYLIFPGTREPIVYPNLNITTVKTIDYYEFVNTTTNSQDQKSFKDKTSIFDQTYTSFNSSDTLGLYENQTLTVKYMKDLQNYYLFIKNISTCQKLIDQQYKTNPGKSLPYQDSQIDIRAYLGYVLKEDAILSDVQDIQDQISFILVMDQMILIFIVFIMVYQVFAFTFTFSNQIIEPVDHLIACLKKIQADELEKVYEFLSKNLVDDEIQQKKKKRKKQLNNNQTQNINGLYSPDYLLQNTSSDSSSSSSSSSSLSSSDDSMDEQITLQQKKEKNRQKILKKKIRDESIKIKKQKEQEQQNQISADLMQLYRVLYEIVHVIKVANINFLQGNAEQALITYAKSVNFFTALQNENAVSICLNNMGNVYMKQQKYIQASQKYQESLQFVQTQREKLIEICKKKNQDQDLYQDEQFRYFTSLFITRSFHLAESLIEAIQQKQYDAMKFLGLFSKEDCYLEIKKKYEVIRQNLRTFNSDRSLFDPMIAHVLLQLALCSIELGKKSEAIMFLEEAEDEIKKDVNPLYPFHLDVPKEILAQRILYLQGYFNIKINQLYIGAIFLTKSIEYGKIYCPKYRLKALLLLKNLFDMIEENKQLSSFSGINYLLEKYRPLIKDVLFLSNISSSMGCREKILFSSQIIYTIFQKYIGKKFDRIGYYLFNESVKEVFGLQRADKNWCFLENMLQNMPTVSGKASISNALNEAFKIYDKNQYYAHTLHMKKVDLNYKKFVILFTDEADILQEGKQIKKQWQKIKENFRFSNIILVIFAFTDNHEVMKIFKELVDYCQDGFVIHYKEEKTIHSYFQNMTETLMQESYEIEYIS
ncbi:von willebrand factor type A domain protein (macronuclear) [Tetrahymena thermophila SB210]|uniref:von willebrand factor type A domain protein n=1 Tax=Tetrahymena thermophila (strain SB210) TaxID=312017 RepID=Q23QZ7_TETTS|nr:von willebrand factor type A domain protein [Tetrahymena thermophila SB210]EAR98959.2 von willebrand factor type A domain protein [Tetrahymena thermophila SB210]|eukprot:XP_001019204.2 von willebrand factor type A domain protein [Tetrahymena thermophila SB210]